MALIAAFVHFECLHLRLLCKKMANNQGMCPPGVCSWEIMLPSNMVWLSMEHAPCKVCSTPNETLWVSGNAWLGDQQHPNSKESGEPRLPVTSLIQVKSVSAIALPYSRQLAAGWSHLTAFLCFSLMPASPASITVASPGEICTLPALRPVGVSTAGSGSFSKILI